MKFRKNKKSPLRDLCELSFPLVNCSSIEISFVSVCSFSEKNGPGVKIIAAEIKKSFFNIIT